MAYSYFVGLPPLLDHRLPCLALPSFHENQRGPYCCHTHPPWSRPRLLFLLYCCTFRQIASLGSRRVYVNRYSFRNYGFGCQSGTQWYIICTFNSISALILYVCIDGIDWVREQSVGYKYSASRSRQGCRLASIAHCWYCKAIILSAGQSLMLFAD